MMNNQSWLDPNTAFYELSDDSACDENAGGDIESHDVGLTTTSTPQKILQNISFGSESSDNDDELDQVKHRPAYCVFVASLAAQHTDDQLCTSVRTHFAEYGTILSVKVLRDPKNRPYAFVQYGSEQDAESALKLGHRSTLNGREVRCEVARVNRTVLICSDRPDLQVTYSIATELCSRYGEVENIVKFEGTPGGGMFTRFAFRDDAARAFTGLQENTPFRVYWVQNVANSKSQQSRSFDSNQLFVGQLSYDVTEDEISSKFGKFGEVMGVEIIRKQTSSDAFAFVRYGNSLSVVQAIERTNHTLWKGRTIHVQCREERKIRPQLAPPPNHMQQSNTFKIHSPFSNNRISQKSFESRSRYKNQGNNFNTKWHGNSPPNKENTGFKQGEKMKVSPSSDFYPMYYLQTPWGMYPAAASHGHNPHHVHPSEQTWMQRR